MTIERSGSHDDAAVIDAAIVDGYTRIPPDEDFVAVWAARTAIEAEPWGPPSPRYSPRQMTDSARADRPRSTS